MKKIIFAIFLFSSFGLFAKNELIIKFKYNSNIDINKLRYSNSFLIDDFEKVLGKYEIKPYISNNLLKAYENKIIGGNAIINNINNSELARIFKIVYDSKISKEVAVAKLKNFSFIEYIEVSPKHRIVANPNDSLYLDQYYLENIKAPEAWEKISTDNYVVVGIVDTGVDIYHEDLSENIYKNPGETGLDSLGNDKSKNGIDDDFNGFIDDISGWDFGSSDSTGQDNLPIPGNDHGTHVAGTIGAMTNNIKGIAGVAKNVKILPVKIADDDPWATSVQNSYEGLLYAAIAGAKVINCSWGSNTRSQAEQEVVNGCLSMGALIVAAAGNNNYRESFYPASYNGVLSVAAVGALDTKANFSNYDNSVDVSAPGVGIIATTPSNTYGYMSGTSMASPVAAGVCALTRLAFPEYSPFQIAEQVKVNADDIDSLNPDYKGFIGLGRVNALRSVTNTNSKSLIISSYKVSEANSNEVFEENELISVFISVKNVLDKIENVKLKMFINIPYKYEVINQEINLPSVEKGVSLDIAESFNFKIIDDLPLDYALPVEINAIYENKVINRIKFFINFKPSYKTMNSNNLSITFNSSGNLAFNDYPSNQQGDGFKHKNSSNLLFEAGLMLGVNTHIVSNGIRGEEQQLKDNSFSSLNPFNKINPGIISTCDGIAFFNDNQNLLKTGIDINQRVYQYNTEGNQDFIIIHYDLTNNSNYDYDSLYAGMFFDWDIGISSSSNFTDFDDETNLGYTYSTKDTNSPFTGVALLSGQKLNYFAIDNDGDSDENPGIYDGYTTVEKWKTLSSGIFRKQSNITDASQVISAGPIKLHKNEKVTVSFGLYAGNNLEELKESLANSKNKYLSTDVENFNADNSFYEIFPNPVDEYLNISLNESYNVMIYNGLGELIYNENDVENTKIDVNNFNNGEYYISFIKPDASKKFIKKFIILK